MTIEQIIQIFEDLHHDLASELQEGSDTDYDRGFEDSLDYTIKELQRRLDIVKDKTCITQETLEEEI